MTVNLDVVVSSPSYGVLILRKSIELLSLWRVVREAEGA